ncbi:MAG: hypothetical protein CMI58_02835 [Parcubacteria group bacterium]|nr:hypothetical protein [Parcubacteria group bacterium]HJN63717.1 XdhC family protein [Flavobacteriales bacterium]
MKKLIEIAHSSKLSSALCTIVEVKGSAPRRIGAKMLVFENREIYGTIGGGSLEKKTIENSLSQIRKNQANLFTHDLLNHHNMCCGGIVKIFIEPIMKTNKIYIFGAGHTGKSLANIMIDLDFDVFVIDERKEYLDKMINKKINKLNLSYKEILPTLPFDQNTYISIMNFEHSHDRDILSYCIKKDFAYLGMIGSKRKISLTKKMFLDGGICTKEEIEKADMPMGIDIKAEGPEEIAISIASKIIELKNTK